MSLQIISSGTITAILRRSGQAAPYQDSISEWSIMTELVDDKPSAAEEDVIKFVKEHITTAKRNTEDRMWYETYWTLEKTGVSLWTLKVITPYTG